MHRSGASLHFHLIHSFEMMNLLYFLCSLICVFLLPLSGAERPKNSVLIMVDDIGSILTEIRFRNSA